MLFYLETTVYCFLKQINLISLQVFMSSNLYAFIISKLSSIPYIQITHTTLVV
jgi:hypothetical protein